jgi:hypothetical protein
MLCTHLEAVEHKVALLVAVLVAHLGLRLEGVKRRQLSSALQQQQQKKGGRDSMKETPLRRGQVAMALRCPAAAAAAAEPSSHHS